MLGREPRIQPPALDAYSDFPLYNTKAVVHQTGVPAPTLRAWERRYGILTPRRAENDYRLYSERDIVLVLWLREQVEAGLTISQAIALLRAVEPVRRRTRRSRPLTQSDAAQEPVQLQQSGGVAMAELRASLLKAISRLDEQAANDAIRQALAVYPVEEVCIALITEALDDVGRRWEEGLLGVTCEHFATGILRAQLESLFRSAPAPVEGPLALVGCAPGEMHEMGALIVALFLRRGGVRVAYLGQSVEPNDLLAMIDNVHPACVALSAASRVSAETLALLGARIAETRKPAPFFCFGGRAFAVSPELAERVPGVYLDGDARRASLTIKKRLANAC